MLVTGLQYTALTMFRYGPWISPSLQDFIMNGCWILSKAFSAANDMKMSFFFLEFVYVVDYIDGFLYIEPIPASLR